MKIIKFDSITQMPASHEDLKNPAVLKRVLAKREDLFSGQIQMINWATLLPGKIVKAHAHESMQEVFLMMGDGVVARVNEQEIILARGDALVVDAKEMHEMRNPHSAPIEYIVLGIA